MGATTEHPNGSGELRLVTRHTDLEEECPELSAAEFQRFVMAANESQLIRKVGSGYGAQVARALFTLFLIGILAFGVFSAVREDGSQDGAAGLTRFQRAVCSRAQSLTARGESALERLCHTHP